MNAEIKNLLVANRDKVENKFNKMVESQKLINSEGISDKKFFFQVVFDELANLSTMKINRILKGAKGMGVDYWFSRELFAAIEKAEYACAKPAREANSKMMHFSQRNPHVQMNQAIYNQVTR
jgi:hypothetical protein